MKHALATAVLVFAVASTALAQDSSNILIVLDASGSMAGKMNGQVKMELAQRVVKDLVDNMPAEMNVGLLVYGSHSAVSKRDCKDIDLIQPVEKVNAQSIDAALARVAPHGMTPIGASLERAAEALKELPGRSTIVLVSDGTETCGSDPCAVAQQVRQTTGIDVRVHVVGLDVASGERGTLECVAKGGGGTYYPVANEKQLRTALSEATARTCEPKKAMWLSIAHPGLGEGRNAGGGFAKVPKRKFYLGFIPGFGWPGYLQVVSAIDAANCKTNDWPSD
ncbi:MAG TPA: VWA domain-containing protein [Myxococcota bacterium]|nr:VWA domain-containing protein [Myxococcota bacterium]